MSKYVYLFEASNGMSKIGMTSNIYNRFKNVRIFCPLDLRISMLIRTDDCLEVESYLHDIYKDRRVRNEWFVVSGNDLHDIRLHFKTWCTARNKTGILPEWKWSSGQVRSLREWYGLSVESMSDMVGMTKWDYYQCEKKHGKTPDNSDAKFQHYESLMIEREVEHYVIQQEANRRAA